ncbi:MAG: hypothetical protein JO008_11595, partial [Alphaproteobacteria bacterium]|nr:hypothetical protein [Alphaproteobacteria bacterium]
MKLYTVTTIAKEYHGYKDVAFSWFRSARGEPRPYGELIENYDPNDSYARWAEDAIDELFTEAEAIALKEYLDREHGHVDLTRINEAELPTPMNTMALGATPFGGLVDCYMCFREPNYDLPFQVEGHFDLRHCEPCRSQEIPVPSFPGFDWYTSSFSTVMENVCAWFPKEPAPE